MGALRFEAFTLELDGEPALLRRGKRIALRPQSLKVLAYLAQHPGQVVTNAELIDNCWEHPKQTHINSVAQCIADIREALAEAKQTVIRTVPRQGYVFAAPVEVAATDSLPKPAKLLWAWLGARTSTGSAKHLRYAQAAAVALVVAAIGWRAWVLRPVELTMMAMPSIAVLPVRPLGDDTDKALAVLGDEIAAGILRAPRGFQPDIRPTSAIKNALADPRTIGRELGVRYLVRSFVRREGEDMRIGVELIEAEHVRPVWVGEFDYRLGQAGAQRQAAASIGRTLVAELLRAEVRRPLPARPGAGQFTMLGRALMTEESNARRNGEAIVYFEKALGIEPDNYFALSHYARAVAIHCLNGWLPEEEQDEKLAKAEAAIKRAREKEPKSPGVHVVHGSVLRAKGEHEQAIDAFKLALAHDPRFLPARAELGRTLIDVGKFEDAIEELEKVVQASPTDISLYWWRYFEGLAALHIPDPERALRFFRESHSANPRYENTLRLMAVALAELDQEEAARKKLAEFLSLRPQATLDDWTRPNSRSNPRVAERRQHIQAVLRRLGMPETKPQAVSNR